MNHPAELVLHQYMQKAVKGESSISDETAERIGNDVMNAVKRQFGGSSKRGEFSLRMSNLGRPTCQLWFEKNEPEKALPRPTSFIMNMMIGDIVEAVFKGLLTEAGVQYEDSEKVTLEVDGESINGTYDLVIDGAVDDVKSASDWSYKYKFESFDSLKKGDAFGYVSQLAGYAKASNKSAGGWWVVNKANGKFKYVPASNIDIEEEVTKISNTIKKVKDNEFEKCFEPVPETFRGKPTGNTMLCTTCSFCDFRKACWPELKELPAVKSQAKQPKVVSYIELKEEYIDE